MNLIFIGYLNNFFYKKHSNILFIANKTYISLYLGHNKTQLLLIDIFNFYKIYNLWDKKQQLFLNVNNQLFSVFFRKIIYHPLKSIPLYIYLSTVGV